MTTELAKSDIQDLINQNSKFKSAYFWTPPSNASGRRSYERYNSRSIAGTYNGHEIDCNLSVTCSCKNVYVSRRYNLDGKTVTIAAIKKLIRN